MKKGVKTSEVAEMLGVRDKFGKTVAGFGKDIKNTTKLTKQFRMEYLSVMFFGMQVWRVFGGFFRSLIQNYKDLDKKGNKPLTRALTRVSAAFTFLKFQILDAMSGGLAKFFSWLSAQMMKLADASPETLEKIGYGLLTIAALGLAAFAGAQVKLFSDSVTSLVRMANIPGGTFSGFATGLQSMGTAMTKWAAAHPVLAGVLLLLAAIYAIANAAIIKFPDMRTEFKKIWSGVADQIKGIVNQMLEAMGFSVELEDTWRALGAALLWVHAASAMLIEGMLIGFSKIAHGLNAIVDFMKAAFLANLRTGLDLIIGIGKAWSWVMEQMGGEGLDLTGLTKIREDIDAAMKSEFSSAGQNLMNSLIWNIPDNQIAENWARVMEGPAGILKRLDLERDRVPFEEAYGQLIADNLGLTDKKINVEVAVSYIDPLTGQPLTEAQKSIIDPSQVSVVTGFAGE
jgi:hypothetical protein